MFAHDVTVFWPRAIKKGGATLQQQVGYLLESFAAQGLLTSNGDALAAWAEALTHPIHDAHSRPCCARATGAHRASRWQDTSRAEHPCSAGSAGSTACRPRIRTGGGGKI